MSVNIEDLVTAKTLGEELGVAYPTALKLAKDSLSEVKVSNVTFYSRSAVRAHLFTKHEGVLRFLGLWDNESA
jgi:hypothetical protein